MSIWSTTNVPVSISLDIEGWVLIDAAGARIDWPALPSAEIARKELRAFKRELASQRAADYSEAVWLGRMAGNY